MVLAQQISVSAGLTDYLTPNYAYASTCVRTVDSDVYCCGSNDWAELGSAAIGWNTVNSSPSPSHVVGLSGPAVQISTMSMSTCALLESGAVECWGRNTFGQLGIGSADNEPHPAPQRVVF